METYIIIVLLSIACLFTLCYTIPIVFDTKNYFESIRKRKHKVKFKVIAGGKQDVTEKLPRQKRSKKAKGTKATREKTKKKPKRQKATKRKKDSKQ